MYRAAQNRLGIVSTYVPRRCGLANYTADLREALGTATGDIDPVVVGNPLTYTVTVTNAGPSPATNVGVTDILPAGVTVGTISPSQGTCSASGGIRGFCGALPSRRRSTSRP